MKFDKDVHYSIDLEKAIIGACLLEKEAIGRIYSAMQPEYFYHVFHQQIFGTIQNMFTNGLPIDILTVVDQLVRVQNTPKLGPLNTDYYVSTCTNAVVGTTHLEYHAHIVKTMWMEREIVKVTHGGESLTGDARQKIQDLQEKLLSLQNTTAGQDWSDMTALMVSLYQHQEEMRKSQGIGLSCGILELDRENGGFHPGQMIVIGARPSVGKSALLGSIAIHMAQIGKKVGIVSLEMSNNEIAARIAALDTNTDFSVLFRGLYQDSREAEALYNNIASRTSNLPIYVSDATNVDIVEIKSKAMKLKSLHGLDCLMIDYLQLIDSPESKNRNRENEISRISRYCKVMAKEMNIPIVLLCQLNREVTKRTGEARYPHLSDLRESGSIEQDADVVMFLHRDWMSGITNNPDTGESTEFTADLVVRKWRNGKNNFMIPLEFDAPKMRFYEKGYHPQEVPF
jgi:replicative DNA helicase